jgi:ribosomal-protein-alanine N-acetyltransferase
MTLSLRPIRQEDWMRIHEWAQRPEVVQHQPWGPNTPEQTRAFVDQVLAEMAEDPGRRVLAAETSDGTVVGIGDLSVVSVENATAEVGYAVHHDLWGRGYATRIGELLLAEAFEEMGLHRVQATCHPDNLASARVLRKLGMTHEGRLRQNLRLRDGWRDSELFSILDREWQARC